MIEQAWRIRYLDRAGCAPKRNVEDDDLHVVSRLMRRLQGAHRSGDTASVRRWLHAVQVAIAACAPSHAEEMRLALGDIVGLLGLDDTHIEEG